jgi:hypothetical protein
MPGGQMAGAAAKIYDAARANVGNSQQEIDAGPRAMIREAEISVGIPRHRAKRT